MENKDYFKKYYQKNREKILFRVKANYIKNKFTKSQVDNKDEIIKIKTTNEPIIISFD